MRDYELTYIIKPDLDPATLTSLIERINGFVTAEGGKVAKTNQWGARHLAYPIRKYREGQYVFSILQLEAVTLGRIEQRLRLQEDVLRYLLVRADDVDVAPTGTGEADVMGGVATEAAPATETPVVSEAAPMSTPMATPTATPAPAPAAA